ncbi:jg9284 [Pararge aegeria aegeria]|uniref:Jg9284 protein n=1 Tax=Pararge aegeria aegeria TaxID=348720 RepID=A0A8S4SJ98_9NEOP|nr:jg9284 [Pararge aegeria aegeria]
MLRIPWNAFRTNKAILEELCITQRLSSIVQARILTFFGHVSRRDNDSIERLVVPRFFLGQPDVHLEIAHEMG